MDKKYGEQNKRFDIDDSSLNCVYFMSSCILRGTQEFYKKGYEYILP